MSCSCNLDVSSYPIKHPPSHKSLPTSTICLLEGFSAPHLAQLRLCWCGPALLPSHPATLCLPQPFQPSSVQKIVTEYQLWTKNIFLFPSNFPATLIHQVPSLFKFFYLEFHPLLLRHCLPGNLLCILQHLAQKTLLWSHLRVQRPQGRKEV